MTEISRSGFVSLAHRYWNFDWDLAKNRSVYGDLASVEGIGSNLRLVVTGASLAEVSNDLAKLKGLVDHRALFTDVPKFARAPSTLETITCFLRDELGRGGLVVHEDDYLACVAHPDGGLTIRERVFNLEVSRRGALDPESGLVVARGSLSRTIRKLAPDWGERWTGGVGAWGRRVFHEIRAELADVTEVMIHLSHDRGLRLRGDLSQ